MSLGNILSQVFGMGGVNQQLFYDPNGMGIPIRRGVFIQKYHGYSPAYWNSENRDKLEKGDKIVLPASALEKLTQLHITFPIMFKITHDNPILPKSSHCSVLEFTAPEGCVYLPLWMIDNLGLDPSGDSVIELKTVELPKGSFVQFQAHETKFAMLSNPRIVLEKSLRSYSCLTVGDTIQVEFAKHIYKLDVTEVKPSTTQPPAISIIETDIKVDFKEPRDYKEWCKQQEELKLKSNEQKMDIDQLFDNNNSKDVNISNIEDDDDWIVSPNQLIRQKSDYFKKIQQETGESGYKLKDAKKQSSSKSLNSSPQKSQKQQPSLQQGLNKSQRGQPLGIKKEQLPSSSSMKDNKKPIINNNNNNNKGDGKLINDNNNQSKKVEEIVGNMRYIYEIDENGERKLLRRLPLRDNIGGNAYSLK
jgi:hypothetical protein